MSCEFHDNRASRTAHSGVDDGDMGSTFWVELPRLRERIGGLRDRVGGDLVRDVHQLNFRADGQNNALHGSDVVVGEAEVREKRDDGAFHC